MPAASLPALMLKKNEERRPLAGHLWAYSNEVDTRRTPLDAFEAIGALQAGQRRFDVLIVDSPAFIRRRKDIPAGERAFQRLNRQAMQLLAPRGFLISSSCSMQLAADRLQQLLLQAARDADRHPQILERGFQSVGYPLHPAIPGTAYLKTLFCRALPARD